MQRALMITVFDAAGEGSAKPSWVLIHRARADGLRRTSLTPHGTQSLAASGDCVLPTEKPDRYWSAPRAAGKPSDLRLVNRQSRKPDRYWSAPQAAESPMISVPEIGYVRRSEVSHHPGRGFLRSLTQLPHERYSKK